MNLSLSFPDRTLMGNDGQPVSAVKEIDAAIENLDRMRRQCNAENLLAGVVRLFKKSPGLEQVTVTMQWRSAYAEDSDYGLYVFRVKASFSTYPATAHFDDQSFDFPSKARAFSGQAPEPDLRAFEHQVQVFLSGIESPGALRHREDDEPLQKSMTITRADAQQYGEPGADLSAFRTEVLKRMNATRKYPVPIVEIV